MSCRVSTTSLIAGACVAGNRGLGVLGSVIRSTTAIGAHGAGYLYNDWQVGDDDKEFRGLIVTPPSAGTFFAREDGSFDLTGAPDGSYSFVYRLLVDGADLGTATATVIIFTPPVNSTAPTVTGSAVPGQTLTSSTGTWANTPTSYAYRWLRGATAIAGATASTYVLQAADVGSQVRVGVIATNSTGSSIEALSSQTAVVTALVDSVLPTLTGVLTVGTVTNTSIQVSWPAGADNVAVTGYEMSYNGSVWTLIGNGSVLSYTCTVLTPGTSYTIYIRAKDAAGNSSTPPLQITQSTSASLDIIAPLLSGVLTTTVPTSTGYVATSPAATDAVGVTGYQYRLNAGSWTTLASGALSVIISGRTPSTTDLLEMRAFDAALNYSLALSLSVTLGSVIPPSVSARPILGITSLGALVIIAS